GRTVPGSHHRCYPVVARPSPPGRPPPPACAPQVRDAHGPGQCPPSPVQRPRPGVVNRNPLQFSAAEIVLVLCSPAVRAASSTSGAATWCSRPGFGVSTQTSPPSSSVVN